MSSDASREFQTLISQMLYQEGILTPLNAHNGFLKKASGFYQQLEEWDQRHSEAETIEALRQFNPQQIGLLSRGALLWLGEQILRHQNQVSWATSPTHLSFILNQLSNNMQTMDEFSVVTRLSAVAGRAPVFPAWAFSDPRTQKTVSQFIETGLTNLYTTPDDPKIASLLQIIPLSCFSSIVWTADNSGAPTVVQQHTDMYELSRLFAKDLNWDRQKCLLDRWGAEVMNHPYITAAFQSRFHGSSTIFSNCPVFDQWVEYAHEHWAKEDVVKLFEPIAHNLSDHLLVGSSQLEMWKTIANLPNGHKAFQIVLHSLVVALPHLAHKNFSVAALVADTLNEALADPQLKAYLPTVALEEIDITQYFAVAEQTLKPPHVQGPFTHPRLIQRFASSRLNVLNDALKQLHPSVWGTAQALLFSIGGPPVRAGTEIARNGGSVRRQIIGTPKSTTTPLFYNFENAQAAWDSLKLKAALEQSLDGVPGVKRTTSKL